MSRGRRPRSQRGKPLVGAGAGIRKPGLKRTASYYVGVDLGQSADYTAICIGERVETEESYELHVGHLERFRHVLYPDVVTRVEELLNTPPLAGDSYLLVDKTGVGGGVTDLFAKRGIVHSPISITGGNEIHFYLEVAQLLAQRLRVLQARRDLEPPRL